MSQSITLQVPFNENIERKNQEFFFQYVWKKHFTELKKAIIYAIIFLSLGFLPLKMISRTPASTVFKFGGFLFVAYTFLLLYQYYTTKKKTDSLISKQIHQFKQKGEKASFIILDEESITLKNPLNTLGAVWDSTQYKLANQYVILSTLQERINIIFNSKEFNGNDYQILLEYLQRHSKLKD